MRVVRAVSLFEYQLPAAKGGPGSSASIMTGVYQRPSVFAAWMTRRGSGGEATSHKDFVPRPSVATEIELASNPMFARQPTPRQQGSSASLIALSRTSAGGVCPLLLLLQRPVLVQHLEQHRWRVCGGRRGQATDGGDGAGATGPGEEARGANGSNGRAAPPRTGSGARAGFHACRRSEAVRVWSCLRLASTCAAAVEASSAASST